MHLREVNYSSPLHKTQYPFSLPLFKEFRKLSFISPITIFVGENGTGKSTLIEGIAAAVGSITIGDEPIETDKTMESARVLSQQLKLVWKAKTKRGFFLRAEDFISYTRRVTEMTEEFVRDLEEVERTYKNRSLYAKQLASLPYNRSLHELKSLYGDGLHVKSHGESFIELFHSRFVPNGLYILDEPETPLSPMKQLAFISMIKDMIKQNAQFIIATHSPILMAIPGADIYSFDENPIRKVTYDELEHVNLTRSFLNNPEQYLRHL